tara:strand:+ start:1389 stop:3038 length:1650 start_codon:yes stop_codon:yes gene_type:complete
MKKKVLFIGANSRIVKSLNVPNAVVISHAQIDSFTFDEYSEIFLFSWSNYSLEQNLELINKLPRSKIIFISTIAVFATFLKQQWNNYPNWKLVCERYVLSRGGKVVRFGIFDEDNLNKLNNLIPHTTSKLIESYIGSSNKQVITNLFYLKPIDRHRKLQGIESFINIVSSYLPGKFIFQAPFELILKLLGSKYYGYTYHCLRFFRQNFQVGYGVIGSKFYAKGSGLVCSDIEDTLLNENGFKMNRLGHNKIGLGKYWHGVRIVFSEGQYFKKVPLFVERKSPPSNVLPFEVSSIEDHSDFFCLSLSDEFIDLSIKVYCKSLTLAAGAIQNCILLAKLSESPMEVKFDDHELSLIGSVDTKELISKSYLSKMIFLAWGRKVFVNDDLTALIDFRPTNIKKHRSFYNDTSSNIFIKIFKNFSFSQLNEAFFNKFGFCIITERFDCYVQVLARDSITLSNGALTRIRLDKSYIEDSLVSFTKSFDSFQQNAELQTTDAIHINGGSNLLNETTFIKKLIDNKRLRILGSPNSYDIKCFHHTLDIIDLLDDRSI